MSKRDQENTICVQAIRTDVFVDIRPHRFQTVDLTRSDATDIDVFANMKRCEDRLRELRNLNPDWYDEDSVAPTSKALDDAGKILKTIPKLAESTLIFPTPVGGVLFEYECGGWDYSVEIDADGKIEIFGIEIEGTNDLPLRLFEQVDKVALQKIRNTLSNLK